MKFYKIFILSTLLIVILILPGLSFANENNANVGTRSFNFLKINIGARPMAMGGAFTGVADDESSLYYNPAGIATLEGKRFIAGYRNNIFDMQSGFLGYIHPIGVEKKVALFINYLNYGDFIRTDKDGVQDGTFGGSDILFAASYAMAVTPDLSVGATAKLIYEKLETYSSTGFAVDLGGKYSFDYGRTTVGFMIQNLGSQLNSFVDNGETNPLPVYLKVGGAHRLKGLPVLLAADVVEPLDNDPYVALGTEWLNLKPLFLRLGWTSFGANYKTGAGGDDFAGFSFGFGVEYKKVQISYTISPEADLGTSHRITFTGGF
jgi:hypothetical protein